MTIETFKDKRARKIWERRRDASLGDYTQQKAYAKMQILNAAEELNDLRVPPGNRLEALKGDRKGTYSIRVNSQWRLCFKWENGNAYEVEFCDYHD